MVLAGCATTSEVAVNPAELTYKEISASDLMGSDQIYQKYFSEKDAAYKVLNVCIKNAETESSDSTKEILLVITDRPNDFSYEHKVYATNFAKEMNTKDPGWKERIEAVSDNKKYNGNYAVYLYGKKTGNWIDGYTTRVILFNIEGIPTTEQIEADKAAEKKAKAEIKTAAAKKEAEENVRLDAKGKAVAKGYTYHGIDEAAQNAKLFNNKALKEGHAYYISALLFNVYLGGDYAQVVVSLFGSAIDQKVDYINKDVRGEVLENAKFFGNYLPVTVVVAGGEGYSKTPVILGLVKDDEEKSENSNSDEDADLKIMQELFGM